MTAVDCKTTSKANLFLTMYYLFSAVSYGLILHAIENLTGPCDGPEGLEEAIEFAMRISRSGKYGPWIPLRLTWHKDTGNYTISTETIRGYAVETHGVPLPMVTQQVTICGEDLLPTNASEIQFRWMNTATPGYFDLWAIFNVTVHFINKNATFELLNIETSK